MIFVVSIDTFGGFAIAYVNTTVVATALISLSSMESSMLFLIRTTQLLRNIFLPFI